MNRENIWESKQMKTNIYEYKNKENLIISTNKSIDDLCGEKLLLIDDNYYIVCSCNHKENIVYVEAVDTPPKNSENFVEDEIICPYCGYKDCDSWEFTESGEYECHCGALLHVEVERSVTYSAKVLEKSIIQDVEND
jgi:hypothetical protein